MKIKHFAGYGSVNAKKVSLKKVPNEYNEIVKELVIKVEGNHEWGIARNDTYDIFNWLVKRFDKTAKSYQDIITMHLEEDYDTLPNGTSVETCTYTIYLK